MEKNIIPFRKYYFIFLNSGLIYFGLAFIIIGKGKASLDYSYIDLLLIFSLSILPAFLFLFRIIKRRNFWQLNLYKKLLIIGHTPLFVGFILSVVKSNYYYLIAFFFIFLLNFLVLIPLKFNRR
ncbi:MAG: hypothetical protein DSY66_05355 [Persephonella sp.]|nr:MAG: hypothetical protein DSY53_04625 [Persephonella sp.]RUM59853.1 MAG: hypothetical protein DSY66_05355 [Persephonella sp.]